MSSCANVVYNRPGLYNPWPTNKARHAISAFPERDEQDLALLDNVFNGDEVFIGPGNDRELVFQKSHHLVD